MRSYTDLQYKDLKVFGSGRGEKMVSKQVFGVCSHLYGCQGLRFAPLAPPSDTPLTRFVTYRDSKNEAS